jgi:hypothetical protein
MKSNGIILAEECVTHAHKILIRKDLGVDRKLKLTMILR